MSLFSTKAVILVQLRHCCNKMLAKVVFFFLHVECVPPPYDDRCT